MDSITPKPEQFFLSEADSKDDLRFRAPVRLDTRVRPLIDGIPTFVALEEAIADAEESVYLSFWIFQPQMSISSRKLRSQSIRTWRDLLVETAGWGVKVYVLIADFDPIFAPTNHSAAWSAYRMLIQGRLKLEPKQRENLQVVCSRHGATLSKFFSTVSVFTGGNEIEKRLNSLVWKLNDRLKRKGLDAAIAQFRNMPGLWPSIRYNDKKKRFELTETPEIVAYSATHHQKIAVIDNILG